MYHRPVFIVLKEVGSRPAKNLGRRHPGWQEINMLDVELFKEMIKERANLPVDMEK